MFRPQEFTLTFIKKEQIARDTYAFYFDRENVPFDFLAGQYVRIILPFTNDIYMSRFFTIASSPLEEKYLIIITKRGKSGFKQTLFDLKPQDETQFFGPNGGIYLREDDTTDQVFLAGGLGIIPFYTMILYAAARKISVKIILIVSFSYAEEMIYYDQLQAISKQHSNIKIIYTLTRESSAWKGERGRISETLIRKYVPDIVKPQYYIVGFPEMVNDTEELLENMGVGLEKIKIESFTGY
jgi:ferredoxin-NADP reductase